MCICVCVSMCTCMCTCMDWVLLFDTFLYNHLDNTIVDFMASTGPGSNSSLPPRCLAQGLGCSTVSQLGQTAAGLYWSVPKVSLTSHYLDKHRLLSQCWGSVHAIEEALFNLRLWDHTGKYTQKKEWLKCESSCAEDCGHIENNEGQATPWLFNTHWLSSSILTEA